MLKFGIQWYSRILESYPIHFESHRIINIVDMNFPYLLMPINFSIAAQFDMFWLSISDISISVFDNPNINFSLFYLKSSNYSLYCINWQNLLYFTALTKLFQRRHKRFVLSAKMST